MDLKADSAAVWKAFTDPEILKKWWFPHGFECSFAKIDLVQGGVFHYFFKNEAGLEFWSRGICQTIEEPTKLVYLDSFSDKDGNAVPPSVHGITGDEVQELPIEFSFTPVENNIHMEVVLVNPYVEAIKKQMLDG